jgi:uncharacterized membrane protein YfcA
MDTLVLILVGAVAGTLAGLLGIGGGAIIVPVLALLFEHQGVDPDVVMQAAIGTSLATIVFTAISSVRAHQARGAIRWPVFWQLTPGILVGALIGAAIAHWLPGKTLKMLFGVFLLLVAIQMARGMAVQSHRALPARRWMLLAGGGIGVLSSLFGIGGGSLSVPFLTWCSLSAVEAIATSAAIGLPIALAGTFGYVVMGTYATGLPPWSVGYVVLAPFAGVVVASVVFAPLGVRLAHRLPHVTLQRVFAIFLTALGLRLLLG